MLLINVDPAFMLLGRVHSAASFRVSVPACVFSRDFLTALLWKRRTAGFEKKSCKLMKQCFTREQCIYRFDISALENSAMFIKLQEYFMVIIFLHGTCFIREY